MQNMIFPINTTTRFFKTLVFTVYVNQPKDHFIITMAPLEDTPVDSFFIVVTLQQSLIWWLCVE